MDEEITPFRLHKKIGHYRLSLVMANFIFFT